MRRCRNAEGGVCAVVEAKGPWSTAIEAVRAAVEIRGILHTQ